MAEDKPAGAIETHLFGEVAHEQKLPKLIGRAIFLKATSRRAPKGAFCFVDEPVGDWPLTCRLRKLTNFPGNEPVMSNGAIANVHFPNKEAIVHATATR